MSSCQVSSSDLDLRPDLCLCRGLLGLDLDLRQPGHLLPQHHLGHIFCFDLRIEVRNSTHVEEVKLAEVDLEVGLVCD